MPKRPLVLEEVNWIKDAHLRDAVQRLLDKYPDYLKQPASISGKYHKGENRKQHIQMALVILKHICDELDITGTRRNHLFVAMILHDIGCCRFMRPGRVPGWKYYESTGWSRKSGTIDEHPVDGFKIIMEESVIMSEDTRLKIANMVLKHMSHWYPHCPMPETDDEKWIAISDYIASREDIKFVGLEVEDWTNEQRRDSISNKNNKNGKQRT